MTRNIKLIKRKKRFDHFYGIDDFIWNFQLSESDKTFWKNMREFGECIKG